MYLIINTAYKDKAWIALADEAGVKSVVSVVPEGNGHMDPLVGVEKGLKENGVTLESLEGIIVNSGPGAFSALRGGIVVANTLLFALGIPVVGIPMPDDRPSAQTALLGIMACKGAPIGNVVEPEYGREPNITVTKEK
ncbi:MAG: hypothetical protein Q8P11_01420 [bacterium]|nr:hypothetical protein [bacterium]